MKGMHLIAFSFLMCFIPFCETYNNYMTLCVAQFPKYSKTTQREIDKLYKKNQAKLETFVRILINKSKSNLNFGEILHEAKIGFYIAYSKYDKSRKCGYYTFAMFYVRKQISCYIRTFCYNQKISKNKYEEICYAIKHFSKSTNLFMDLKNKFVHRSDDYLNDLVELMNRHDLTYDTVQEYKQPKNYKTLRY